MLPAVIYCLHTQTSKSLDYKPHTVTLKSITQEKDLKMHKKAAFISIIAAVINATGIYLALSPFLPYMKDYLILMAFGFATPAICLALYCEMSLCKHSTALKTSTLLPIAIGNSLFASISIYCLDYNGRFLQSPVTVLALAIEATVILFSISSHKKLKAQGITHWTLFSLLIPTLCNMTLFEFSHFGPPIKTLDSYSESNRIYLKNPLNEPSSELTTKNKHHFYSLTYFTEPDFLELKIIIVIDGNELSHLTVTQSQRVTNNQYRHTKSSRQLSKEETNFVLKMINSSGFWETNDISCGNSTYYIFNGSSGNKMKTIHFSGRMGNHCLSKPGAPGLHRLALELINLSGTRVRKSFFALNF